jgi:hypothetical protein
MSIGAETQSHQNHKTTLKIKGRNRRSNAGVAQLVEQLICNQQVAGSSPFASSEPDGQSHAQNEPLLHSHRDGFPSGQREQTVNLSPLASKVRILPRPRRSQATGRILPTTSDEAMNKENEIRGSSSVGRAPAFQAGRRGFEPRLPLTTPWVMRAQVASPEQDQRPRSSVGRARPW